MVNLQTLPALTRLIPPGSRVCCAVSGGADSVCLLHLLASCQKRLQCTVAAAHYNHHLRGSESDRDETFVRSLCDSLGIALTCGGGDVAAFSKQTGQSLEQAARTLRYAFLRTAAGPNTLIATAHTAGDNLETILINLVRGTGLSGLCGIPEQAGPFIRPLLAADREDILSYLHQNSLQYVEDSSNAGDAFVRNRIRHQVIPLLKAENPSIAFLASDMAARLRQDEDLLRSLSGQTLNKLSDPDGSLDCGALLEQPPALQSRVILLWLRQNGLAGSRRQVDAVSALARAQSPSARYTFPGGFLLQRRYDRLLLTSEQQSPTPPELFLNPPCRVQWGGYTAECLPAGLIESPANTLLLDPASVCGMLRLRSRQAGDTIRLGCGTKSLKKLLIDLKVPADLRDCLPVLADDSGALAIYVQNRWLGAPKRGSLIIRIESCQRSSEQ